MVQAATDIIGSDGLDYVMISGMDTGMGYCLSNFYYIPEIDA